MAETLTNPPISMAIDIKKKRIRIHKPTLHLMGDPKLIQILYDPSDDIIALRSVDHEVPGGQEVRVRPYNLRGENCCDFYSSMLVRKLRTTHSTIMGDHTYRLTGAYIADQRLAVFPMSTLKQYAPFEEWHHVEEITATIGD